MGLQLYCYEENNYNDKTAFAVRLTKCHEIETKQTMYFIVFEF